MLFNFDIYTGKDAADDEGLTHAVVHRLTADLAAGHNVVLFTDNFYTSPALAESMFARSIYLTGTLRLNRCGVPEEFQCDRKAFKKRSERGVTRYIQKNDILYQQWKDRRCVTMLSTIHRGNDHCMVTRNAKVNGAHQQLQIRQPKCIRDYNQKMGGVDCFDQHVAAYRVLRRTRKYWRSIFLDCIDITAVNSYKMFQSYRQNSLVPLLVCAPTVRLTSV